jgi:hypothetical protein
MAVDPVIILYKFVLFYFLFFFHKHAYIYLGENNLTSIKHRFFKKYLNGKMYAMSQDIVDSLTLLQYSGLFMINPENY